MPDAGNDTSPLPGAPPLPVDLAARLAAALAAKGPTYVPRTHHRTGAKPRYTNRLILEPSPYLLQHAHNPVSWHPWGDDAFAEARRLDRPVFLSIGYSTCHWCHVMEGESFEDEEIAAFLNAHFVCIKVDREERPDVDAVYMAATQALTGSGGWPMSVWLTAAREPFFAGTYFPPRDGARGARRGFLTLLGDISATWQRERGRIDDATRSLTDAVKAHMEGGARGSSAGLPDARAIAATIETVDRLFDPVHGGFRRAPKFPSNVPVRVLLRHHRRTGDARALEMATLTLEKMAAGGMYDQIGGGFHRYSTDERWLVPHFEKMLYDNALLVASYVEAYQVTKRRDFARVARETLDYVLREMTAPEGAFHSATDADSEGHEGKFFVWSAEEVRARLGPDAEAFSRHYDISEAGNWEGTNIPHVPRPDEDQHAALAGARATLYAARAQREPPLRDEKILAAWNGLMISAFALAGFAFDEPRYVAAAARAADFLLTALRRGDRLVRSYKDGVAQPHGFLEDQVFVTAGLLDLYEATFDVRWLQAALGLAQATETHFADAAGGGWFTTAADGERLIAREKPLYDGAEPSGTSVALRNALRLAAFTGDDVWRVVAERGLAAVAPVLADRPLALAEALLAVDFHTDVPREIGIVWRADPSEAKALVDVVRDTFLPNRALAGAQAGGQSPIAFLAGRPAGEGATAYVCEHGRCDLPTAAAAELRAKLASARPHSAV